MPVNAAVLTAGLAQALAPTKDVVDRFDAVRGAGPRYSGMLDALETFANSPASFLCLPANRWADDLGRIDRAVAALRPGWTAFPGAGPANDPLVEELLRACAQWLGGVRPTITSWRAHAVREVYWKVAWCYSCAMYKSLARALVLANNPLGAATDAIAPLPAVPVGGNVNPYMHPADYVVTAAPAGAPHLLRGDSRSPATIHASGGFQPRNIAISAQYHPWFAGNAVGDTVSTTQSRRIAINAAWQPGATAMGVVPAWLDALIHPAGPLPMNYYRGFVYEFGNLGVTQSIRVTPTAAQAAAGAIAANAAVNLAIGGGAAPAAAAAAGAAALANMPGMPGVEEVFLAIPNACITRWWAVRNIDKFTFGPFPYPAGAAAPVGAAAPGWSAAAHTLA